MTEHAGDVDSVAVPPGGERVVSLKLLATNVQAGAIIGKSGATISEMQTVSKATIQISRANELFVGTSERLMQISGQLFNVRFSSPVAAMLLCITCLHGGNRVPVIP